MTNVPEHDNFKKSNYAELQSARMRARDVRGGGGPAQEIGRTYTETAEADEGGGLGTPALGQKAWSLPNVPACFDRIDKLRSRQSPTVRCHLSQSAPAYRHAPWWFVNAFAAYVNHPVAARHSEADFNRSAQGSGPPTACGKITLRWKIRLSWKALPTAALSGEASGLPELNSREPVSGGPALRSSMPRSLIRVSRRFCGPFGIVERLCRFQDGTMSARTLARHRRSRRTLLLKTPDTILA